MSDLKRILAPVLIALIALALAACGAEQTQTSAKNYTAQEIYDAVAEAYGEDFLPDGPMNEAEYTETYSLDMNDIEDHADGIAMVSFEPDRLVVLKCKAGKGEQVQKTMEQARETLVENGMWYPANLAKVNASRVLRQGDYVAFMMLGATNPDPDASEEDAKKFAEEQIKIGVDAFNELFK